MSFLNKQILLLLFICPSVLAYGQDTDMAVDTGMAVVEAPPEAEPAITEGEATVPYNNNTATAGQWQSLTNDKAFGYRNEQEYIPKPEKEMQEEKPSAFIRFLLQFFHFFTTTAGHIVLWSLLALIVGFIVYRVISGEGKRLFAKRAENMNEEPDAPVSEEDLLSSNWEDRMQAAIRSGDMRAAIRYSYMLLLQMLQHRSLIQYRQDKTNSAYYRELADTEYRQPFRQLSRQYEFTWYGNFLPSETTFQAYMQTFSDIKNRIGSR